MVKEICTVCGRLIDSRGMSGHMRTHKGKPKEDNTDGIISYPSNDQEITVKQETVPEDNKASGNEDKNRTKKTQTEKKTVTSKPASKPASSPASKPDPRGQRKTETEQTEDYHKAREWKGLFRE